VLIFQLANMLMRHAVNRARSAVVKSTPAALKLCEETINDPGFAALLAEAKAKPKSQAARTVLVCVLKFADLIRTGAQERVHRSAQRDGSLRPAVHLPLLRA
jgi:hypothetical protein